MRKFLVVAVIIAALLALSNHSKRQRATLPDLRGLTLSHAQDRARAQGFDRVESQDATPEDRAQLLMRRVEGVLADTGARTARRDHPGRGDRGEERRTVSPDLNSAAETVLSVPRGGGRATR